MIPVITCDQHQLKEITSVNYNHVERWKSFIKLGKSKW